MSPAQTMLYFREWGRYRDVQKAKGLPCGDVQRHALHKKALGQMKSSKDFTNADLDKILAAMRAVTEPGNLTAQLRALDQPELRRQAIWKQVYAILEAIRIGNQYAYDQDDLLNRRVAYVDGLVAKVIKGKQRWDQLTDQEAAVILGIIQRRQAQLHHPASGKQAVGELRGEIPF